MKVHCVYSPEYEGLEMPTEAYNALSDITGKCLGPAIEKHRPVDFTSHKAIDKKTSEIYDYHLRFQQGEDSRLLHDLNQTEGS